VRTQDIVSLTVDPIEAIERREIQREAATWIERMELARSAVRPYTALRNQCRLMIAWAFQDRETRLPVVKIVVHRYGFDLASQLRTIRAEQIIEN
jgi:hypothetical protein